MNSVLIKPQGETASLFQVSVVLSQLRMRELMDRVFLVLLKP